MFEIYPLFRAPVSVLHLHSSQVNHVQVTDTKEEMNQILNMKLGAE